MYLFVFFLLLLLNYRLYTVVVESSKTSAAHHIFSPEQMHKTTVPSCAPCAQQVPAAKQVASHCENTGAPSRPTFVKVPQEHVETSFVWLDLLSRCYSAPRNNKSDLSGADCRWRSTFPVFVWSFFFHLGGIQCAQTREQTSGAPWQPWYLSRTEYPVDVNKWRHMELAHQQMWFLWVLESRSCVISGQICEQVTPNPKTKPQRSRFICGTSFLCSELLSS